MDFQLLFTTISFFFIAILMISAIVKRNKGPEIIKLIGLLFFAGCWEIVIYLSNLQIDPVADLWINKAVFFLIPFFLVNLYLIIIGYKTKVNKISIAIFSLSVIATFIISLTPGLVKAISYDERLNIYNIIRGDLYPIFFVTILIEVIILFYELHSLYRSSKGIVKLQAELLFYGTTILMVATLITNSIIPSLTQSSITSSLSSIWIAIWLFVIFHTTLKHRLFDINFLIGKIIYYFLFTLLFYAGLLLIYFLLKSSINEISTVQIVILGIPLALVLVSISQYIRERIENVSSFFLFHRYNPEEQLKIFSFKVSSTLEMKKIIEELADVLNKSLQVKYTAVLLKRNKETVYNIIIKNNYGDDFVINPDTTNRIFLSLTNQKKENAIIFEEIKKEISLENKSSIKRYIEETRSAIILKPIIEKAKYCYIVVGERFNDMAFSQQDINFLSSLLPIISTALARSLLYSEAQQFADTLKLEVERATRDLRKANSKLKEVDSLKDDLISIAGHELRSPATIIMNNLYLLEKTFEDPKKRKMYMERIKEGTRREVEMVTTLLEASRFGKKNVALQPTMFDIFEMAQTASDELTYLAKEKYLDMKFINGEDKKEIDFIQKEGFTLPNGQEFADASVTIEADQLRIREVIDNLTTNAIKYTESGWIRSWLTQDKKNVWFYIQDTGVGIKQSERNELFQKFSRIKNHAESGVVRPGGTGLGLCVAREVVKMHAGQIKIESKGIPGEGSLFYFNVPKKFIGKLKQSSTATATSYDFKKRK